MSDRNLCPVFLFSGKGGVGKTTLAAATAVRLAAEGSRVLLMSTDPAHNLSDVLQRNLGPTPQAILPGLDAMEVDASGMFGDLGDRADSGALSGMMKLVSQTPGIDEFGAIEVLLQVLEASAHDVVIVDTAPTGHTLRLLMVPDLLDGWYGTLLGLRHNLARAGRLLRRLIPGSKTPPAADLERELSGGRERIKALRDQLADSDKSQIILVTIPEPMSVLETARTAQMLRDHKMSVASIVVNQLQPDMPDCMHCRHRRQLHLRHLAQLKQRVPEVPLRVVEAQATELRGDNALRQVGQLLWEQESS